MDDKTRLASDETQLGSGPEYPASAPRLLDVDQEFGSRYHIIKLLGKGGMGAVYQAWDAELGVVVAIKVIRPEAAAGSTSQAALERRFKRELVLARQVTHKNVVRIHDLGEIDGIKYITMPFLDGEDLSTVLAREQRLPVARVLRIARGVVAGLEAAHVAGIVHRDLKPANIMIGADDEAMIMDFGIARSAGGVEPGRVKGPDGLPGSQRQARAEAATTVGEIVGTVEYMAPEQASGKPADQRADIYAFGLMVRDMLLGRSRVSGSAHAIVELRQRMQAAPASLRSIDPTIPEAIDRLVDRCLSPDPSARYATSHELAVELDRLDTEGLSLPVYRRLTPKVIAAAATLVLALLGGTFWLAQTGPPPVQPEPMSVLVADFVNGPGDPAFQGALEQALNVAIEEAAFITAYPRRDALRLAAELRPGRPLDEEGARLVSLREGVKIVLAGAIQARGSGYFVTVKLIDPAVAEPLATATAPASSRDDVLAAVAAAARRIRTDLGDVSPDNRSSETLTAASLDAVREYSQAQDLAGAGRDAEAVDRYRKAIAVDSTFGRAYSGLATSAYKLGRTDEAEQAWNTALSLMDRMSEREKFRTLGTYFLGRARNYDKAIDNYEQLVRRYPADSAGHNNLAVAYFSRLDFKKALEEGRRARDIYPKKLLYRTNLALYAMYAGDFSTAAAEAAGVISEDPKYVKAYLPIAIGALAAGKRDEARAAYGRMAEASASGASLAAMGLSDLAMYEGRFADAEKLLTTAITVDEQAKNSRGAANKLVALAESYLERGRTPAAIDAATRALAANRDVQIAAALIFLGAGRDSAALDIAVNLGSQLPAQPRAYAKVIEAQAALRARKTVQAVEALQAAIKLADLWIARYLLGVAYVEAGYFAEGLAELDVCDKRRAEATAIFLDDMPSFRRLAPLHYWLGRAQQGVGQLAAAKDNYAAFVALRPASTDEPLVRDARSRLR